MLVYDVKRTGHLQWKFMTSGKRECLATAHQGFLNVTMDDGHMGTIKILEGQVGSYVPSWDEIHTVISHHEISRDVREAIGLIGSTQELELEQEVQI